MTTATLCIQSQKIGYLEDLYCEPLKATGRPPILMVHGAFAGAWCWQEHYLTYFAQHGWSAHALSLSGHAGSQNGTSLDTYTLDQYVQDVMTVAKTLPQPPILIGHSMGGLVVQKALEEAQFPAVVLLCSVPPSGVSGMAFSMLSQTPHLLWDLKTTLMDGRVNLQSVREGLFYQPVDELDLARYAARLQPESLRAMWDMSFFSLPNRSRMMLAPMLIAGAQQDLIVPPSCVEQTAVAYGQSAHIFPEMGHNVMLERNWEISAQAIEQWLAEQAL